MSPFKNIVKSYLILFLMLPFAAMAQQQYVLNGYIAVAGGESFTYKLFLTDSTGKLEGYSITYLQPVNDIKAAVTATIDRAAHTLTFRETSIIYNNGFQSNAIMCLVSATLNYKDGNNGKGKVLTGAIRTSDASNTSCGGGTVSLVNENELTRLFNGAAVKDTIVTLPAAAPRSTVSTYRPRRIVVTTEDPPKPVKPAVDEVTNGTDKTYLWHTDTVVIDIWDGGRVDDDIVTLLYNEKPILQSYHLTAAKKQLRIAVSAKTTDVLTIIAENEGNEPPNTANILLHDGATTHDVIAYNERHERAVIKIKRQQ